MWVDKMALDYCHFGECSEIKWPCNMFSSVNIATKSGPGMLSAQLFYYCVIV